MLNSVFFPNENTLEQGAEDEHKGEKPNLCPGLQSDDLKHASGDAKSKCRKYSLGNQEAGDIASLSPENRQDCRAHVVANYERSCSIDECATEKYEARVQSQHITPSLMMLWTVQDERLGQSCCTLFPLLLEAA